MTETKTQKILEANHQLTRAIEHAEQEIKTMTDNMFDLQQFRDKILEALAEDMPDCFIMDKLREVAEEEKARIDED